MHALSAWAFICLPDSNTFILALVGTGHATTQCAGLSGLPVHPKQGARSKVSLQMHIRRKLWGSGSLPTQLASS